MAATNHYTTLKFSSFYTMWSYIRDARLKFYELDYTAFLLTSECTSEQIDLALNTWGAKMISKPRPSKKLAR